jgi:hypothetical protein
MCWRFVDRTRGRDTELATCTDGGSGPTGPDQIATGPVYWMMPLTLFGKNK